MSAEKSRHSAGWYAGALVFWLLSAWLITVGLSSIIPQIFPPTESSDDRSHAGPRAATASAEGCVPSLRALRQELLEHASQTFFRSSAEARTSTGSVLEGAGRESALAWFDAWDQRLFRERNACSGDQRQAWNELNRLRHGLSALSDRFEHEERPHLERLDELLGPASAGPQTRALPAGARGAHARAALDHP